MKLPLIVLLSNVLVLLAGFALGWQVRRNRKCVICGELDLRKLKPSGPRMVAEPPPEFKICVNTREYICKATEISYREVVDLATMLGTPSVTYYTRKKGDYERSGIMHPGCKNVRVESGMIFNVVHTSWA